MKAFIVYSDYATAQFVQSMGYEITDEKYEADLFVFTGGSDIPPSLYNQIPKFAHGVDNQRTDAELKIIKLAHSLKIPMLGICRGAQLLNVVSGGSLFQHVTSHTRDHVVYGDHGEFMVTSSHHQMMIPDPEGKGEILLHAKGLSDVYLGNDQYESPEDLVEPEVILYKGLKTLCVQPHPEWMRPDAPFVKYIRLVMKHITENKEVN